MLIIPVRVAGTNKLKIDSVKASIIGLGHSYDPDAALGVAGIESGVPEQPWKEGLGVRGARNRAKASWLPGYYAVGHENWIDVDGTKMDYATVCVITPSGKEIIRTSFGVPVPSDLIEESRASGWVTTCGKLEAARTPGLDHANPHPKWSGYTTDRPTQLREVVTEAFVAAIEAETHDGWIVPGVVPSTHTMTIAGCERTFPVCSVGQTKDRKDIYISLLLLYKDAELTDKAAFEIAQRIPDEVEVLVMPDGKAQPLLHAVQFHLELKRSKPVPVVLARKEQKSYMRGPIIDTVGTSITTQEKHRFFLDADDAALIAGRVCMLLDDVISSGRTFVAMEALLMLAGAVGVLQAAVGTEGGSRPEVIALVDFPLWIH